MAVADDEHTAGVHNWAPEPTEPIQRIMEANTALRLAQDELREAVEDAHQSGCTWEAIATALGTAGHTNISRSLPSVDDIVHTVLGTDKPIKPA